MVTSARTATRTATARRGNAILTHAGRLFDAVDRQVTARGWVRNRARPMVPQHWSFWLGHLALFSFVVVLVSGVFLTMWFEPSITPVVYDGAYRPLQGVVVSEAFASTLDISFETRGGLLMRQIHSWATHLFIAAMALHLLRIFFTGGFRKPRQRSWLIGLSLLVLGIVGGYTGHALPDDQLSGTGLRVVEGGIRAIPLVGTDLSAFIFGGEFPGVDVIARLNLLHVVVVPALMLALLVAHLVIARRHGPSRMPGRSTTSANAVDVPRRAHFVRAGALALIVSGFTVVMAATLQINPVWLWGPSGTAQVSAGSQPPWYMGFLDGAARLMPPWEIDVVGFELALSVLVPVVVLPGAIVTALAVYPWIERKIIGDSAPANVLDRPRSMPVRTGLGAAFITFYLVLWIAGGNDILATTFDLSVNGVTRFLQVGVIVLPVLAYSVTRRICLGLRRRDHDRLLHGRETGYIFASPDGGFSELHVPLSPDEVSVLAEPERPALSGAEPAVDENGIPARRARWSRIRTRLAKAYYGDDIHPSA